MLRSSKGRPIDTDKFNPIRERKKRAASSKGMSLAEAVQCIKATQERERHARESEI